ncbi:MAG TPA: molecular chaperone DnaK [Crinalium sp.]
MTKSEKIIGIDLGTTNSCVAVLENGKPVIIPSIEGGRTVPSVIGFREAGRLIGELAKRQAIPNAKNTVYSIKRFIGRRWDDTETERSRVPYQCVSGKDKTVNVQIGDRRYTPQEISAFILHKLKEDAEHYLNEPVTQAVITVPAYFTEAQRKATKDAGRIAGLDVKRIINEPTAAALAYGLARPDEEQCILVFDLGGGTFDVSILRLGNQVIEVIATAGNNRLGGDDFDSCIVNWLITSFQTQEGIDLSNDPIASQRLREAAERAKIELSTIITTSINLPFITVGPGGPKNLDVELTRTRFEGLTRHLIEKTLGPVKQAIADAGISAEQIDRILLVGGSTRIPAVQSTLRQFFNGKALDCSMNPDEVVALGAAVQGGILAGELRETGTSPILLDVTPLSLGIETLGGIFTKIIDRNTTIPTSQSQMFSTAFDQQTSVEVHVLQGEAAMSDNNISLGKLMLTDIPPAPRAVPQIEVVFEIDVDGILTVSARDTGTGRLQKATFVDTGHLSKGEMQAILRRWEDQSEMDQLRKQLAELRNQAEISLLNSYEPMIRQYGKLFSQDLQEQTGKLAERLRKAIANPNITLQELQQRYEAFQHILMVMGKTLYEVHDEVHDDTPTDEYEWEDDTSNLVGSTTVRMDYESVE